MLRHKIIGIPLFIALCGVWVSSYIQYAHAITVNSTLPFGGRVLTTSIPTVTCTTLGGTAPVVLTSNLASIGRAVISSTAEPSLQRSFTMGSNLYRAIPLYTQQSFTAFRKQPKPGDWILGRQQIIPDLSTCITEALGAPLPFPVVKTDNYGVSQPIGR